jgi:hypothetical protein
MPEHKQPSSVNESFRQGGEARAERMLSALGNGVKGGK